MSDVTRLDLGHGAPDRRENLFGGRKAVLVWSLLRQAAPPFSAVLYCELEAGGSVGPHVQAQYPEIVIGLQGRGTARVADVDHRLDPGSVVHLPLGSTLAIGNDSTTEPLRYLIVKAAG